ncbi:MAG: hypothetical protein ACK5TX_23870 [Planctomyces sp.]
MQLPGLPSLLFLFYLLLVLPWMAFRSRQKLNSGREADVDRFSNVELGRIWRSTLINLLIMFVLSWTVGHGFGFRIFALPTLNSDVFLATTAALTLCFLLRFRFRMLSGSRTPVTVVGTHRS